MQQIFSVSGWLLAFGLLGYGVFDVALDTAGEVPSGVGGDLITMLFATGNANPIGLVFGVHDRQDSNMVDWCPTIFFKTRAYDVLLMQAIKV